jgi:hypothetical protein
VNGYINIREMVEAYRLVGMESDLTDGHVPSFLVKYRYKTVRKRALKTFCTFKFSLGVYMIVRLSFLFPGTAFQ